MGEHQRPKYLNHINYVDDFAVQDDDAEHLKIQVELVQWFLRGFGFASSKVYYSSQDTEGIASFLGYGWKFQGDKLLPKPYEHQSLTEPAKSR